MTMLLCIAVSSMAMSYEQARDRALFLTDKMAYELNLNDEQYEAAYEVNLDYLMSINTYDDLYGTYWTRRNLDLSYILLDWQYNAYCAAAYFYRPLAWTNGVWRFGIYARYPNRTYFYFGRPGFYATYYGGHSWHMNGGRSWYHGRTFGPRPGESRFGMRDRYDRGDFRGPRGDNRYDRNNGNRYDRNNGYNNRYDRNNGNRNDNNGRYDRNDNRYDRNNNNSGYRGSSNTSTSTPNRGTSTSSTTSRPQNDNQNNRGNNGNSGYRGGNNRSDNYSTDRSSTRMTVNREMRNQVSRSSANVQQTSPRTSVRSSMGGSTSVSRPTSAPSRPASTFSPSSSSRSSQSSAPRSTGGGRSGGGGSFGGRR